MKFEISYVCYQYLGYTWVTCWRITLALKKKGQKRRRRRRRRHFELFVE
jgi:hypothetical protein